jgi:hypothetical protein
MIWTEQLFDDFQLGMTCTSLGISPERLLVGRQTPCPESILASGSIYIKGERDVTDDILDGLTLDMKHCLTTKS